MLPDPNDRPTQMRKRRGPLRGLTVAIAATALTVFAGLIGYTYFMRTGDGGSGVAPLIKADPRPMKVAPDKPGGMDVPHQDKEIYGQLGRETAPAQTARTERLLPPPEAPMDRPRPANAPPPLEPEIPAPPSVTPPPGAVEVTQPPSPTPPPPAPRPNAAPAPQAAPPANVARAPTPPPAAVAPSAGGRYRIQLAALRTNDDASREWDKLRRAHPDLLGSLSLNVVRADLGDRGTFYRIQAGPLADENAAKEVCRRLAEKKVGCLVVRP
jgi:cell division septation protein DedD